MFLIFRMENQPYNMGRSEFVALVAVTISLAALAIDSMLPAIGQIASDLGARDPNDRQLVITMLFLGLAVAQMIYGPLSDSLERTGHFPELALEMVRVGEQTGSLPDMLNHVADFYDEDVNLRSTALLGWVEPMILLFVAVFIATVLISLYMPIFSLGSSVGR